MALNPDVKFIKTDKGREEIEKRTNKLPPLVRRVLIMIDGKATVEDLVDALASMLDAEKVLITLEKEGFIVDAAPVAEAVAEIKSEQAPQDMDSAKRMLADMIFKDLGHEGGMLIMKLAECTKPAHILTHMQNVRQHYEQIGNAGRGEELLEIAQKYLV